MANGVGVKRVFVASSGSGSEQRHRRQSAGRHGSVSEDRWPTSRPSVAPRRFDEREQDVSQTRSEGLRSTTGVFHTRHDIVPDVFVQVGTDRRSFRVARLVTVLHEPFDADAWITAYAEGARCTEFSGWTMPLQYHGVLAENRAVRTDAGIFDVSHLGRFEPRGSGTIDLPDPSSATTSR